ncbi:MAG: mercuric reductase [Rhodothermia bacterium]|nr:mercuric reductase [Rhodothermia bacterium]
MQTYDHIILGTGQATGTLLGGLLPSGDKIAVVEGNLVGGTCVNTGCTPTKTLVASARVAHVVRRAPDYGIHPGGLDINFPEVMARMNHVRGDSHSGMEKWLTTEEQITLFRSWGSFEGPGQIRVGDEIIEGDQIYINVGARPRVPDLPGLDDVPWLDNARLLDLDVLPEHLIILGGSYIGLEFSQIFRRFGSKVTILEQGSQIVFREDEDVAEAVNSILTDEGIDILLETKAIEVCTQSHAGIVVTVEQTGERTEIEGSHLLIAAGRVPNSDRLNLDAAGIETDDRGYIVVDDHCRTTVDAVFAVGDVNGKGAFTHTSVNDAEIVLDLTRGGSRRLSDRIPTYALFIDPALGRVGLTEREALSQGYNVLKATRPMSRISRAKEMGETKGFAKLLVDADTDLILGAAILGPGGDEIVNMFAAYMYSGRPCRDYRKSVLIHPTISELMPWILDTLEPVTDD